MDYSIASIASLAASWVIMVLGVQFIFFLVRGRSYSN